MKKLTLKAKLDGRQLINNLKGGIDFDGVEILLEIDIDCGGTVITVCNESLTAPAVWETLKMMAKPCSE